MTTDIREYRQSDFDACRCLWVELTQRHRDIYEDPMIGGDDPGHGFEGYLANPERRGTWVAEIDGEVVGMSGLIVHGEEAEIEPVVVSARYRSRGIGAALVQHAVREAKNEGVRFLSVRPVARNKEAISFFVRLGFNLLGQVDLFQDLSAEAERKWLPGITLHGHKLQY
jgi:GNAT superfamily N-acetyltransferase